MAEVLISQIIVYTNNWYRSRRYSPPGGCPRRPAATTPRGIRVTKTPAGSLGHRAMRATVEPRGDRKSRQATGSPTASRTPARQRSGQSPCNVSDAEYALSVARNYPRSRISQVALGSAGRRRSPFWVGQAGPYGPTVIMKFPGFVIIARNSAESFYLTALKYSAPFAMTSLIDTSTGPGTEVAAAISAFASWAFTRHANVARVRGAPQCGPARHEHPAQDFAMTRGR